MFWLGLILGGALGMIIMAMCIVSGRSDDDGNN